MWAAKLSFVVTVILQDLWTYGKSNFTKLTKNGLKAQRTSAFRSFDM